VSSFSTFVTRRHGHVTLLPTIGRFSNRGTDSYPANCWNFGRGLIWQSLVHAFRSKGRKELIFKPPSDVGYVGTDAKTGQPITTCDWIDQLAPKAWAVVAAGTCATYGGIHAMEGNPTGCMGLADYLGWNWKSEAGIPIVCVPGCPVQPDSFMEVLLYLLNMAAGRAPMIPLDDALRPAWLFGATVHEGCDRGGHYEQAQFAEEHGLPTCIVKLGCWGPVVQCNVGKRGWMGGIGGCPNVGGICIGCTMPGFPDKFMPFMNQPPGSPLSSAAVMTRGRAFHALRRFTQASLNKEPPWRSRAETVTPQRSGQHSDPHGRGDCLQSHPHGYPPEKHSRAEDATPVGWMGSTFGRLGVYQIVRLLAVGIVHGLAGSAAVALLVLTTIRVPSWAVF
jgi:hypothetical protein